MFQPTKEEVEVIATWGSMAMCIYRKRYASVVQVHQERLGEKDKHQAD